ncbi:MAG: class I SAM-dependent methyltransferase [Elusimicrobiota bacterium]|jgi:ubiquinone/menaquinone biosynthesis C-methylase UbiE|nr:class I SAM-dependent methyltransferase [Elusimicrobiota bacterium]
MNKKTWILLVFIGTIIVAGCASKTNLKTKNITLQTASGEWHWENFTDEEIDSWSQKHYPSFYTLIYQWPKLGKKTLLDVGAGQGHESIIFAERGFDVSAVDINKFAMDRLSKIAADKKLSIKTKVGDVRNLPYPDKSFDLVYANQIVNLNGCTAMPSIIKELNRVTKDGGNFFFTINVLVEDGNPLFKDNKVNLGEENCVPGANKYESICFSKDQYKTAYCAADQAMLEKLLKPYKVKWVFMDTFLNPVDLTRRPSHYHILIEKK